MWSPTCKARPAALYDQLYCQRGEAENRIKETQLDLFGTRASCHKFRANQFRLLLAALAYTLMQRLRALALSGTELARACAGTIRTRLLKIGVAVLRNTRRVRLMFASHHPLRGCSHCRRRLAAESLKLDPVLSPARYKQRGWRPPAPSSPRPRKTCARSSQCSTRSAYFTTIAVNGYT